MQTNLDKLFKTNKNLELDGVWLWVSDTTAFLCARYGGANSIKVKASVAKFYKPVAKMAEVSGLSPEKDLEISVKMFVHSCLLDWKGVTNEDGSEIEFSFDNAVKLLTSLPELFDHLVSNTRNVDNFKEEMGNDLQNS